MAGKPLFGFISLILTAGAIVMLFFVILAGTSYSTPLNQVYFLKAATNGITGAPATSQWTLWNVCGSDGSSHNINCGKVHAANPFQPQKNFGTTRNVPADFLNHHRTYYYLSRFMFAFFLISLFFSVVSLFTGLLALCSRLGSALSSFTAMTAAFFLACTASFMTAVFVLGRNAFRNSNRASSVGVKAFAFTWASFACLFIASILYCMGFVAGRRNRTERVKTVDSTSPGSRRRFTFFRRHRRRASF